MPNSPIPVYNGSPEQVKRVQNFIQWLPDNMKKPQSVVIVPKKEFGKFAHNSSSHGTGVALSIGDRTYLNDELFDPKSEMNSVLTHKDPDFRGNALEWTLAHETAHMNSNLFPRQQEDMDWMFDQHADQTLKNWNSPAGRAYQAEQARVDSDGGRFQPSPTQVQSALNSPLIIGHEGSSQPQPTPAASIGPRMQP